MSPRIPLGTDRLSELQALVQVAERGNLSAAARQLGVSPSAVSKLMTRLETRLGVQLLHRSTRKVQLKPEGWRLYEQGQRVLADLDELERSVATAAEPRGTVRITASTSTGHMLLVPLVPRLLAEYPGLSLDLRFTDEVVDLADAGIDIAARWGQLPASDLIARPPTWPRTAARSNRTNYKPTSASAGTTAAPSRPGRFRSMAGGSKSTLATWCA